MHSRKKEGRAPELFTLPLHSPLCPASHSVDRIHARLSKLGGWMGAGPCAPNCLSGVMVTSAGVRPPQSSFKQHGHLPCTDQTNANFESVLGKRRLAPLGKLAWWLLPALWAQSGHGGDMIWGRGCKEGRLAFQVPVILQGELYFSSSLSVFPL